jgi:TIR domain
MTDVAHNAPGPASPKPGDVALHQASRANAPDKGKLRVFISYSRDDANFADQLDAALDTYGFETSIDRHNVPGGEEWKSRLGNLISEADTVVFVLTPTLRALTNLQLGSGEGGPTRQAHPSRYLPTAGGRYPATAAARAQLHLFL